MMVSNLGDTSKQHVEDRTHVPHNFKFFSPRNADTGECAKFIKSHVEDSITIYEVDETARAQALAVKDLVAEALKDKREADATEAVQIDGVDLDRMIDDMDKPKLKKIIKWLVKKQRGG